MNHHPLRVHALEGDRAWLDFHELFATPRSASDYLWLIEHFPHMAVSGLDRLGDHPQDVSQRFLNFIDIAYDRGYTCGCSPPWRWSNWPRAAMPWISPAP